MFAKLLSLSKVQKIGLAAVVALLVVVIYMALTGVLSKEGMKRGGGDGMVTIHYHYTDWCRYCQETSPILDAVMSELPGRKFRLVKHDEDKEKTPGVKSYPTIFVEKGDTKTQYTGDRDHDSLKMFFDSI